MRKFYETIISTANRAGDALMHSAVAKKVAAGVLAFTVVMTPVAPSLAVLADEVNQPDETIEETTTTAAPTETTVTEATQPVETTVPDYSDYAQSEPVIVENDTDVEVSDPTEAIDATAPPAEREATEVAETEAAETESVTTSVSETEETSVTEETVETTEPTESSEETIPTEETTEPVVIDTIQRASSAEEYVDITSAFPSGDKLIIKTTDDLSSLNPDYGAYFDGTYMLGFTDQRAFNAAVDYAESKGYEYIVDGQFALCGDFDGVISYGAINPSATTKVAVIDSGSNLANEKYSVIGDDVADHVGHGTAVCNYILNETSDAYIISIKAFDGNKGQVSDVYTAIQYAESMDVDYILLAMSIKDNGEYDALKDLIAGCKAQVVASAGNYGRNAASYIPANVSGVLAVGAIDDGNNLRDFSNYGTCVTYYVPADSTSEASAKALGRLIAGSYVSKLAFVPDSSTYYMDCSEKDFELQAALAIQSTTTIQVLSSSEMNGWTADEFRHEVLDYADWYRGSWAPDNGCIELVKQCYEDAGSISSSNKFLFTNHSAGCTTSMRNLGYPSPNAIGITDLHNSEDTDVCIESGEYFYYYITTYGKPGDIIMFGYPADSNGLVWHHAAIYAGTGTEGFATKNRPAIKVIESPGNGQTVTTRMISAADFHQWGSNAAKTIFTTAVLLTPAESSPEAYFSLSKTVGSNQSLVAGNTYNFTLTDNTASVTVATGSCTATASGKAMVTWSNVASGYSLEDQNTTVILIPDHQYTVAETTTTVGGRALSVAWTNGTTSLGTGNSQTFTATDGSTYSFNAENSTTVQVSFTKASSNPTCVANNAMYSLAGTTYAIYGSQSDAANDQNRLTLKNGANIINFNANGVADTVFETLDTKGLFFIKELTAGPGYKLDTATHTIQLSNEDTTIALVDDPLFDPFEVSFVKRDKEGWNMVTELKMANATFDFYYFDNDDAYVDFATYTSSHTAKVQGVITMSDFEVVNGKFVISATTLNNAGMTYFAPFASSANNDIPIGTYIIKEKTGPAGYTVAPEEFAWSITQNGGSAVVNDLTPANNVFYYTAIAGSEVEMREQVSLGVADFKKIVTSNNGLEKLAPDLYNLDGTQYEVYDASNDNLMLTITFDGNGDVKNVVYASGVNPSAANKWTSGNSITLPYTNQNNGSYYIKEKTSTKGYYLDTAKHNFTVTATSTAQVTVSDEPVFASFDALLKKATSTALSDEVLSLISVQGATFTVTYYPGIYTTQTALNSATPLLEATFKTDANGVFKFDEAWYTTEFASSMYSSYVNQLKDKNGNFVAPMGTYVVREITAPSGLDKSNTALIIPVEFNNNIVKGSADDPMNKTAWTASIHYAVLSGVVYNESTGMWEYPNSINPTITTRAANTVGGTELKADKDQSITDSISVTRLAEGFSYKDTAWLVSDNGTPNDLSDDFYVPFSGSTDVNGIPSKTVDVKANATGSSDADFTIQFDGIDATNLGGHTITVCNEIYLVDTNGVSHLYLSHKALDNKLEQVTVPAIRTTLLDVKVDTFNPSVDVWGTYTDSVGYRKVLAYGTDETLIDYVSYKKLKVGEEYEATATLKNKDTGEDLCDASGKPYTATKKFTASSENGVVEVEFTGVDTTVLVSSVVCFEDIKHNGISIASHADLSDEWQELERVELKTTAIDKNTGTRVMTLTEEIPVMDKVEFNNLKVGDKYIVEGSIMQADGTPLLDKSGKPVVVSVPFTPTVSSGETWIDFGKVYVPFTVTSIVIFENLYLENHTLISVHADLNDKDQTLVRPTAHTVANINGQKAVWLGSTEVVTLEVEDKIMFEGLIPGKVYRADGSLMKADGTPAKDKDGKESKATVLFTPTEADGEVIVKASFTTEGLVEGDTIVVFEKIYDVAEETEIQTGDQTTDILIASHEDLNDRDQTITVHFRPMTGGIDTPYAQYGLILVVAALGGLGAYFFVKKKNERGTLENK